MQSQPTHFEVSGLESRLAAHTVGDVRDLDALVALFKRFEPEVVFHLAAQPIVKGALDDPKLTFDTNVGGTVNLLEALRLTRTVKAAVLITSDKCYENVEWEFGYRETDPLGGKDPYSASKACAEMVIRAYSRSFFNGKQSVKIASTRAGNVIGGGDWARARIVPDCVSAWAQGKQAVIRNPHATRPWQHVLEPVGGYLWLGANLLTGSKGLDKEAFNFGPAADANYPVSTLVDMMALIWPDAVWNSPEDEMGASGEAKLLKLCCDKALARLDWKPTLSFEETVRMTAEWYLAFYRENRAMHSYTINQIREYQTLAINRGRVWAT